MLDKSAKSAGRVLLPLYVKPEKYDLKITPDLVNYTFDGVVSIDMTTEASFTEAESKTITLHAKELMFRKAEFHTEDGKIVPADEVSGVGAPRCVVMGGSFGPPFHQVLKSTPTILLLSFLLLIFVCDADPRQSQGHDGYLCVCRFDAQIVQNCCQD